MIDQESTIHGIRYFVDGENLFHRIVWMLLVGISVFLLAYLIYDANKWVRLVTELSLYFWPCQGLG